MTAIARIAPHWRKCVACNVRALAPDYQCPRCHKAVANRCARCDKPIASPAAVSALMAAEVAKADEESKASQVPRAFVEGWLRTSMEPGAGQIDFGVLCWNKCGGTR